MLKDIRFKRTMLDIMYPSPKAGMNPRSLAYLKLVLADKRKSVLFATFPKSGWNWTADILNYSLYKKNRGNYNIAFRDTDGNLRERLVKPFRLSYPADSRARNAMKLRDQFPGVDVDYILHVHEYNGYSPLWGLTRAKTVFITRNIPTALYSNFKTKSQIHNYKNFEHFLDTGFLDRIIHFYNSWGDYCEQCPPDHYKLVKYEDMRENPQEHFSSIYRFVFKEPVAPSIIDEALAFYSFEKQKEREFMLQQDEHKHFHFRGKKSYFDMIAPDTLNYIHSRIKKKLRHSFGYDYNNL